MNKQHFVIRSLFTLCLTAISVTASAQQVSQQEAANIALQFLKGNDSHNARLKKATPDALKLVYTEPSAKDRTPNLYIYNMEGGGFAIVSGDARTGSQILGYSFDNNFSAKGMPENVKYWLGEYSRQIDFIKTHQPEVSESKRREGLKKEGEPTPPTIATTVVAPLLKTTWGQGAPYNGMTPTLKNEQQQDQNTVTGCVATAMAQIMNYWHWPAQGKGKHTYFWVGYKKNLSSDFSKNEYDWKNMADPYDETQSYDSDDAKMKAVAQLMYDCGVAVDMDYGLKASGAYDEDVVPALTSYFGYSHNISLRHQSEFANNDAGWIKLLTDELDASRPVYYAAEDADNDGDAHAFVVDGYGTNSETTYFHINWGWDGYDGYGTQNNNGYFVMKTFNPWYRENRNEEGEPEIDLYNQNSVAIIGIQPAEDSELTFENLADGWDDEGNWGDEEDFGTGTWKSNCRYYSSDNFDYESSVHTLLCYKNTMYPDIYKICIPEWRNNAFKTYHKNDNTDIGRSTNGKTSHHLVLAEEYFQDQNSDYYQQGYQYSPDMLYFYWNSYTNECCLPTQSIGLIQEKWEGTGTDNPTVEVPYELIYKTPEEDTNLGNYDPIKEKFTLNFINFTDALIGDSPKPLEGTATLTLTPPEQEVEHRGLYLGDFEEQNGTATQVAGYKPCKIQTDTDEDGEEYYWYELTNTPENYRIAMMPVDEKTSRTDIINFINDLPEKESTYGVGCDDMRNTGTSEPEVTFQGITEGAYYVVVAHYDDNNKFTSYEYMPVFFSKEENWEEIGTCLYDDDIVGGVYAYGYTECKVLVEQYKGGNLIKNEGDRLLRIKNPYGEEYFEYVSNSENWPEDIYGKGYAIDPSTKNYYGGDPYRSNVYLYLYVDAENNVSLYPDYFEYQPLGIDWNCGEMMVKQEFTGKFEDDNGCYNIKFNTGNTTNPDFSLMEYMDNKDLKTNYDYEEGEYDDRFLLKLPADYTPKNYLTLYDDEPYTLDNPRQDYSGVYYSRELDSNNNWGTLMLPFKFNTGDNNISDFDFYKLTSATPAALTFTQIDGEDESDKTIPANTPVIFHRTGSGPLEVSASPETDGYVDLASCGEEGGIITMTQKVPDDDGYEEEKSGYYPPDGWSVIGLYNSGVIKALKGTTDAPSELEYCYFFEGDKVRRVTAKINLVQYRAYFHNDGEPINAKQIPVRFEDEEYTSLDALFNGEPPVKKYGKGRFNLQGQAVGKDYKGVIIEDGRKKLRY